MVSAVLAAPQQNSDVQLAVHTLPALVLVIAAAGVCGWLAVLARQPRVLGEMIAGLLLGPTFFGAVAPSTQAAIFSPGVKPVLYLLGTLGLTLYMFLIGAGISPTGKSNRRDGRTVGVMATAGIAIPLALGAVCGLLWYARLSKADVGRPEFALFIGGALAVTAFPMLARIIYERGLEQSRIGRIALLCASIDDAAAWCLLALLAAMHNGMGAAGGLRTLGMVAIFGLAMLLVVRPLLRPLGRHVEHTGRLGSNTLFSVCAVALLAGYITEEIGIYSVFGGFIAGYCMPRSEKFRTALHDRLMEAVSVLILPVFFAYSGLNTNLNALLDGPGLLAFLSLLIAGFAGKYFGCAAALRVTGTSWRESSAIGALMNARGLMILIFINVGLAQGIINSEVFGILVLVAVVTTAAAVPLYQLSIPKRLEPRTLARVAAVSDSNA